MNETKAVETVETKVALVKATAKPRKNRTPKPPVKNPAGISIGDIRAQYERAVKAQLDDNIELGRLIVAYCHENADKGSGKPAPVSSVTKHFDDTARSTLALAEQLYRGCTKVPEVRGLKSVNRIRPHLGYINNRMISATEALTTLFRHCPELKK
jgi:hypothetical protein